MRDKTLVNFLIKKTGSPALAVSMLGGISTQRLFNWRKRGIASRYRPLFREVVNRYGANLPEAWLLEISPTPASRRKADGRASQEQRTEKAQDG